MHVEYVECRYISDFEKSLMYIVNNLSNIEP